MLRRASGAYIFRPSDDNTARALKPLTGYKSFEGELFVELHQEFEMNVSQVVTKFRSYPNSLKKAKLKQLFNFVATSNQKSNSSFSWKKVQSKESGSFLRFLPNHSKKTYFIQKCL